MTVHRVSVVVGVLLSIACPPLSARQWTPLGGPEGGTVSALAFHSPSGAIFAGAGWQTSYVVNPNFGAVYRSLDHGTTWHDVSSDISAAAPFACRVRALTVSPSGEILAGLEGGGVFRSTDAGDHWTPLNSGLTRPFLRALAFDSSGARVACTDTAGVFTMPALGTNWTPDNAGLTSLRSQCLEFGPGYTLVGTNDAGVFKKLGAAPWQPASSGLPAGGVNRLLRTTDGALYAATLSGLFTSTDDAASWSPVPGAVSGVGIRSIAQFGTTLIAGGDLVIYRSDAGQPWQSISTGPAGFAAGTFTADQAGRIFCGTLDSGVLLSDDDGQNWTPANTGLRAITIHRLLVARDGTILAGTRQNGIFRSADSGATWDPPDLPHRFIMALAESPWGDLYAGNYTINSGQPDGHAWVSTDHGDTWTPLDNGLNAAMVSGFAFSSTPGQIWCTSAWNPGGVSFSGTAGTSWLRLGPSQNIPAYCLLRAPSGDLYFGTEGLQVWKYQASTGQWQPKGLGQSQQFALARDSLGNIFVGNDRNLKGVYRSTDDGGSFQPLAGFPGNEGYAILVLPNDEVYAGTSQFGIQRSTDHGDSWQPFNTGMPSSACFALALGPDGHLYAGGAGGGVFRSSSPVACAPAITAQPQPVPGCPGGSAAFSVSATAIGGGALTYQWRKNGAPIAGATLPTLTLSPIVITDDAAYDCLVTSACGTTPSAAARLRICVGDINSDLTVNTADLTALLGAFGQSVPACASGDQNADGVVNTADLTALLGVFGQSCPD